VSKDAAATKRVLHKYPNSIVFADINERMPEPEWEKWIRAVQAELPDVMIGILSAAQNDEIIEKYVDLIKIRCGYVVLRTEISKSISHLLEILKNVDAKGRRKYIRANTENEVNTTVNLPSGADFITGNIKDISVVGFSCSFPSDPQFVKNSLVKDIQIKLQTMLIKAEAIVFGSREDEHIKTYVMLFTKKTSPEVHAKIRKYIQQNLQGKMDLQFR
jgi:hypothetical protein